MRAPWVLTGKHVFITGVSSGIGRATALEMLRRGAHVVATVRHSDDGEQLRQRGCDVRVADLRDRVELRAIIAGMRRIDILINNAAYSYRASVEEAQEEQIRELFDVNLFAPCAIMRLVVPRMRQQSSGCIVNVSSVSGSVSQPLNGYYSATKHALDAVTEALSYEVRPFGIRVISIVPGRVKTTFHARLRAEPRTYDNGESPYADLARQLPPHETKGEDPEVVVDAIIEALSTPDQDALRWLATSDAVEVLAARRTMTEPEFRGFMLARLGMSWPWA